MYAQDNDDTNVGPDDGQSSPVAWGDTIQAYAKSYEFLDCPSAQFKLVHGQATTLWPHGLSQTWSYNYALNDVKDDQDEPIGARWAVTTTIAKPSETILFVDGWPLAQDPGVGNSDARHVVDWVLGERD